MTPGTRRSPGVHMLLVALLLLLHGAAWGDAVATGRVTLAQADPVQGVAGVMVSDGLNITRTDAEGNYTLALADGARFVMVINPPGCEPQMNFHRRLPEELPAQVTADFSLLPSDRPPDAPFTFVHITDSHGSSAMRHAERLITAINALADRPVFVLETGDISCHTGDAQHPMESYGQHLAMPYFPVTGNHDAARASGAPFAGHEFEAVFGPWYHAWYYGRYLFVGLPWSHREGTLNEAAQWLERLLTMNAETEGAHVMVGFHYWDGFGRWGSAQLERFVNLLREFQVRAVFTGHWHMHRVYQAYGIPVYMTRNPVMGNRDLGAGGFHLLTAAPDGSLRSEFRTAGHSRDVRVVSPAAGATLPRGSQPVVVNAYDTALRVRSVSASFHDAQTGALLRQVDLRDAGGVSWVGGAAPAAEWPGQVRLVVSVVDETGEAWPQTEVALEMSDEPLPAVAPGADWPMLQQNPQRTGVSADAIAPPLHLAWAHATGGTFGFNSPIVVDGAVYVSLENNHEPLAPSTAVLALDATTGELRWTHALVGKSVRGTLAATPEAVCALADDGTLFALEPRSGRVLWEQSNLVLEPVWREMFNGSPVVRDAVVVAGSGPALGAYDLRTGRLLWERSLVSAGGRRWTPDPSPTLAGEDILLAWDDVHMLSLHSGEERAKFEHRGMVTFNPTVSGGKVLMIPDVPDESRQRHLAALDLETGEELWTVVMHTRQRGIYTSPVATEDRVYAFDDRNLYAVALETGEVLWTLRLPAADVVTGSAALSGDYLFFARSDGILTAVNTATQELAWTYDLGTRVDSALAVSGNALFVAGRDGTLYGFVAAQ